MAIEARGRVLTQPDPVVGEGTLLASRDYTDTEIKKLKEDLERQLGEHYVSFRKLWGIAWQALAVLVAAMGAGAGIAIAAVNFLP